jgi:AraC family transcriptional regulator, arabinose operon regulatory protein
MATARLLQKSPELLPDRSMQAFAAYLSIHLNDKENPIGRHHHKNYYELLYFIEGGSRILIRGKEYHAASGDLALYQPYEVHEEYEKPGTYRILCLRFRSDDIAGKIPFPGPHELEPVFHLPWKERFHNLIEQIILENKSIDRWSRIMTGTYLAQFVVLLWRALSHCRETLDDDASEARLRMSHIIDLIHRSISDDISLEDLAGKALMSESHFSRMFKTVTGMPPKQYLIQSKLAKAKELLASSKDSVIDIALAIGYDNPQYFSRLFKKQAGLSPLEFRRQSKKVH